jgi:hypothetical protein
VPDAHYATVAGWVDGTHLRGRLVYYRVMERTRRPTPEPAPASLVHKISIRPESAFYGWLERELTRRFDYACCADVEQFRRERKAITRSGQVKTDGERHEKDDRHAIGDRTRYVLGWTNEAKIEALARSGLTMIRSRSFLAERAPPLDDAGWSAIEQHLRSARDELGGRLGPDDRMTVARLLDPEDPAYFRHREDLMVTAVRTVHTATKP